MRQEKGQSAQSFRDQFMVMQQVCEQSGLTISQLEQVAKAVLKREGVTNPTTEQLKQAKVKAVEECFAILFLYMADQQKYGKIIEDMEYAILQKKDLFPKNVSDACRLFNGWHNNYGSRSMCTEANDGMTFATMSEDKEEQKKSRKKKGVTCFRCKKVRHYASKCDEELPSRHPRVDPIC